MQGPAPFPARTAQTAHDWIQRALQAPAPKSAGRKEKTISFGVRLKGSSTPVFQYLLFQYLLFQYLLFQYLLFQCLLFQYLHMIGKQLTTGQMNAVHPYVWKLLLKPTTHTSFDQNKTSACHQACHERMTEFLIVTAPICAHSNLCILQ